MTPPVEVAEVADAQAGVAGINEADVDAARFLMPALSVALVCDAGSRQVASVVEEQPGQGCRLAMPEMKAGVARSSVPVL